METNRTLEEIIGRVRDFIRSNYLFGYQEEELEDDASILELGVIDSTGIIELVMFVEEEYEISVTDSDITPDNFDSINRIAGYIFKKINGSE